jgi:pimeloyl-ACP methyl ester carboxylesterase
VRRAGTSNGERILVANGVDLCVETFGDASDPAILLIHGASASMLWWEEELCERIAASGRYVIRFDNRDTGRSVSYPAGRPEYTLRDMADDAVGILDALGIGRAHLVGRSMAGAIATLAAMHHPSRVASLALVTTTPGGTDLPPMSEEVIRYTASGGPDPSDPAAVVEFIVGLMSVYSGSPYYDEAAVRALAERDVARSGNIASCLTNHFVIDVGEPAGDGLGEIAAPTLVVHGELDPVFPLAHGRALQQRIPGAELLIMERAGHELPPPVWDVFVPALVRHTADTGDTSQIRRLRSRESRALGAGAR